LRQGPGFTIGSLTTLQELAGNEEVDAIRAGRSARVATPQIRNVGTVGGNLLQENRCPYYRGPWHCYRHGGMHCYAKHGFNREHAIFEGDRCFVVSPSDLAPVMVAGNAIMHVQGLQGPRTISAGKLFVPASKNLTRMHSLDEGEVLTAIEFRVREPHPRREAVRAGCGSLSISRWALPLDLHPCVAMHSTSLAGVAVISTGRRRNRAARCAIVRARLRLPLSCS
jgi:CO/xanthine dehydrogenase FAD-binding subunit